MCSSLSVMWSSIVFFIVCHVDLHCVLHCHVEQVFLPWHLSLEMELLKVYVPMKKEQVCFLFLKACRYVVVVCMFISCRCAIIMLLLFIIFT